MQLPHERPYCCRSLALLGQCCNSSARSPSNSLTVTPRSERARSSAPSAELPSPLSAGQLKSEFCALRGCQVAQALYSSRANTRRRRQTETTPSFLSALSIVAFDVVCGHGDARLLPWDSVRSLAQFETKATARWHVHKFSAHQMRALRAWPGRSHGRRQLSLMIELKFSCGSSNRVGPSSSQLSSESLIMRTGPN